MKKQLKSYLTAKSKYFCSFLNYRDRLWHRTTINYNKHFEPESLVLLNMIPQDKSMLDIGANWGAYSIVYSGVLGENLVHSFEPILSTYKVLYARRNGVNCYRLAISSQKGECIMKIPQIEGHECSYRSTVSQKYLCKNETDFRTENVATTTVDDFVSSNNLSVGFIKIDVEGHEVDVLRGANKTIAIQKPFLLIEIEQVFHDFPITDIFKMIKDYSVYFLSPPPTFGLTPLREFSIEKYQRHSDIGTKNYINNFIFIPN